MRYYSLQHKFSIKNLRQPGIEPGSIAWKATMLTFTPPTLAHSWRCLKQDIPSKSCARVQGKLIVFFLGGQHRRYVFSF